MNHKSLYLSCPLRTAGNKKWFEEANFEKITPNVPTSQTELVHFINSHSPPNEGPRLQGVLGQAVVSPHGVAAGRGDGRGVEHRQPLHHLLHIRQHLVHRPRPPHHAAPVPGRRLLHC